MGEGEGVLMGEDEGVLMGEGGMDGDVLMDEGRKGGRCSVTTIVLVLTSLMEFRNIKLMKNG